MVKALAGGGGRGMRIGEQRRRTRQAFERAGSEAKAAFGRGDVYVEELVANARHIEVQVIGDGSGAIVDLGERECSVQRSRQKIMEIAPSRRSRRRSAPRSPMRR